MNEQEFIIHLEKLKAIKPSEKWLKSSRSLLLSSIKEEMESERVTAPQATVGTLSRWQSFSDVVSILLPTKRTALLLRPAGVFFSISALLLTSGIITVSAAQDTIPGDFLYSIKIASEQVQKALTSGEEDTARLEVEFAGKRLSELEQIVGGETSDAEKNKQIVIVITKFEENISNAKAALDTLTQTAPAQKAVAVAQVLDAKSKQYTTTLNKVVGSVPSGVKSVVEEVNASTEKKGDSAFSFIVEKHETGEVVSEEGNIAKEIVDRINFTNGFITTISGDINTLAAPLQTGGVATLDATSTAQLSSARDQLTIAKTVLKESELYLGRGNFLTAFEKAKEGKILAVTAGKRVESIKNELIKASKTPESAPPATPATSTSTPPTTSTSTPDTSAVNGTSPPA